MAEIIEQEGVLVMRNKDGSKKIMTNYSPRIVALVKCENEIIEGVLIEHPPKGTSADVSR